MSNILKSILSEMLDTAEKTPGEPVRRRLSRGLQVDVKIENGKTYLQISRSNQWPDDKEWEWAIAGDSRSTPGRTRSWYNPHKSAIAPANTCEPNGQPNPA